MLTIMVALLFLAVTALGAALFHGAARDGVLSGAFRRRRVAYALAGAALLGVLLSLVPAPSLAAYIVSVKNYFTQCQGNTCDNVLNISGTMTATSTSTVSLLGATSGLKRTPAQSALVGATVVLTAAQSGGVFENRATSGSPSWTLPTCDASAVGVNYTFFVSSTTAGFTITGPQVIHAKTNASGTAITSTTTITNTQGTAVVGDTLSIICNGTAWWMTAQSGIFAAS